MTNMQAAIGLAQMEELDKILTLRRQQMDWYYNELSNIKGITLRKYADWCEPVHWMMAIKLDNNYDRGEFILYMQNNGIDCRQMINPVHNAKHCVNDYNASDYPNATAISKQSVHLPSSTALSKKSLTHIKNKIKEYFNG